MMRLENIIFITDKVIQGPKETKKQVTSEDAKL
jgi:hypothetical protein